MTHLRDASLEQDPETPSNPDLEIPFKKYNRVIDGMSLSQDIGKVTQVTGFLIKGFLPGARIGATVEIYPSRGSEFFRAEVVGFKDKDVLFMPLGEMKGVEMGARIVLKRRRATVNVGDGLLGRVVNGMGEPMDELGPLDTTEEISIYNETVNPLNRPPIDEPLDLGVRSINAFTTVGKGQRVAIMAGSGVGKSVLMGMVAHSTEADINVIALVGERGREVREFIENELGEEGLKKSIVIVATSDQSPLLRMRAAFVATTIAEHFSGKGKDVLLMMDSVTRFAMAQREVGLSIGEPPASKGYTPSVFALLPKLLERAGRFDSGGSITGIYTVLVEGDDMDEPIADAVRSISDGHIVLDRKLAQKGHFPAIDVLQSASRVMRQVIDDDHLRRAQVLRESLATYREAEDLVNIGAYQSGSNSKIDMALQVNDELEMFLRQAPKEDPGDFATTAERMQILSGYYGV